MAGKARDAVRMTPTEVEDFLAGSKKVQVATLNPDGSPHLTTLFYAVLDGRLAFWTYGRSQKIRNLERDPRITCLVESGEDYFELRGVSVRGRAELVRDESAVREIGLAVAAVMVDCADLGDLGREEVERQARKRGGVIVVPERTVSWDHAKMLG
jgi:PPOX class probable F420-dependent enzyme